MKPSTASFSSWACDCSSRIWKTQASQHLRAVDGDGLAGDPTRRIRAEEDREIGDFLGKGHDGLWASTRGRPLSEDRVYKIICRRTKEAFGFAVRPHLFREAAATNIAIDDPENILVARDLLAHKTFGTTEGHYIRANSIKSGRRHQDVIARMRKDLVKQNRDGELD